MKCQGSGALAGVVMAVVFSAGVALAEEDTDLATIDRLYADWRAAVERADIPGYVAVLHPDVRLLPPGAEPIVGAASYAQFLEPVFAAADYRIEVVQAPSVEVFGDLALAEYEYVIHLQLKDAGVGVEQPGALTAERTTARYIDVLRRGAEGRWTVYRHAWQDPAN